VTELTAKSEFNSAAGVQHAVCDLYLLASTNYILGSEQSSFSQMAGFLAPHEGYETALVRSPVSLADRLAAAPVPPPCVGEGGSAPGRAEPPG
jgi:hypothetical protein